MEKLQQSQDEMATDSEFDQFADSYQDCVNRTISISGEDQDYFAGSRIAWVQKILAGEQQQIRRVMDYGCGVGLCTPHLLALPDIESHVGVDVSEKSLENARLKYGSDRAHFMSFEQYLPSAEIDLVVCCNVFHHIPLGSRQRAVQYIHSSLRSGGWLAFWEQNPWNLGTVYIMSRSPLDKDAVRLKPHKARRMLSNGGFTILRTDFLFVFPRFLKYLRGLEPFLSRWPLGAQYLILCRKD
jgi:predicted TPR repeat methyltransferase